MIAFHETSLFQAGKLKVKNRIEWLRSLIIRLLGKFVWQKEQAIKQSYYNIFDNSMVAIFQIRLEDGLLLNGNNKTYEMFGFPHREPVCITSLYADPGDRVKIANILLNKKKIENYDLKMVHRSGQQIWISFCGNYCETKDIFEGIAQDVTHTRRIMEQLHEANFELDQFLYRASHNLRSPLLSIVGLVNLIETEDNLHNIRQYNQYILKSINRLDNTIHDMMVVTKGQRMEEKIRTIDFPSLIDDVWEHLSHLNNYHAVNFQTKFHTKAPYIGNEDNLKTIFNALLSNAVQYSCGARSPLVEVEVKVTPSTLEIKVSDNGDGIKQEHKEQIFNMFYRGTERSQGAGLGLYTVKKLVSKLGGKVMLETVYKKGSTFILVLPNEGEDSKPHSQLKKAQPKREKESVRQGISFFKTFG